VLNGLKNLYKKLSASAGLLSGLRAHDEQIAQLRASLATLLAEKKGLSAEQKAKAQAEIESLLAYQAVSKDETERLRALYESAAAQISELRERLSELEKDRGGRP
jgi:tRNA C32,U32 (ribose-2'-O)-methylase TrmJ